MSASNTDTPGVIEPGRLYTVAEARERLRAGQTTWQHLVRRGLLVKRVGGKSYVLGDDIIRLFSDIPDMSGDD